MEAAPAKVIQYFNGEKQNLIPLFQRPYRWDEPNWQTLWDDVMVQYDMADASNHFMGAIVSVPAKSVPVGVSKYLIIDGQQRLTTVSMLLCALRDSVDDNTAARIQEVYLINRFRDPEDTLKFVPTQIDRGDYKSLVLDRKVPDGEKTSKLIQAYQFYMRQLTEAMDGDGNPVVASKILTTLEQSLQVVMINLGEADDPYLIFESLNFKGEPLNQADLVCNYLMMRFKHSIASGGEQERIYENYWKPLETDLGKNLTEFLRHYSMKDGDDIRQGGIYAAMKQRFREIDTTTAVESEIKDMQKFGRFYLSVLQPAMESSPPIRIRLEHISHLQVGTSYPFLLRLFDGRASGILTDDALEQCLGLVESFIVRRQVVGVPTNALNRLFLQWAKTFPAANHADWLLESMSTGGGSRRFPTDVEFEEAFTRLPQYGRGATRYVLCRLEEEFEHHEPADLSRATIEHVLPQKLSEQWIKDLGADAEAIQARVVDTFGNLTLTGYNSELSNLPFPEKKEKLKATHIELNRWILEKTTWGEAEIMERSQILLASSKKIWKGPKAT